MRSHGQEALEASVSSRVVRLADVRLHRRDWTNQELAQLHRLVIGLRSLGLCFETDRGMSDEGDPWFAFYDDGSDEVFAHFARISGSFVACAPWIKGSLCGTVMRQLMKRFVDDCPCWRGTSVWTHSRRIARHARCSRDRGTR